jgi:hypothetical protein
VRRPEVLVDFGPNERNLRMPLGEIPMVDPQVRGSSDQKPLFAPSLTDVPKGAGTPQSQAAELPTDI